MTEVILHRVVKKLYAAISVTLLLSFCNSESIAQSTSPNNYLEYFPLQINNTWEYNYVICDPFNNCEANSFIKAITGDTLLNSKLYFVSNYITVGIESHYYYRIDSTNGNVFKVYQDNDKVEYRIDSLFASTGDSFQVIDYPADTLLMEVVSIRDTVINGVQRAMREISDNKHKIIFVTGIGMFKSNNFPNSSTTNLGTAYINGQYFDFWTGVKNHLTNLEYSLSQNYPNPFNPTTAIQFTIPLLGGDERGGLVTLKVYDILGREVVTLVNEQQRPGIYNVEFDASGLASGVYYCRLQSGRFSETRKMVLLR